jgi:glycosyltransferase involved in cell wall biosynthesis
MLAMKILLNRCKDQPVIYSRNINATWIFVQMRRFFKKKHLLILYEVHNLKHQPDFFFRTILLKADGLVCITHALKQALIKTYNLNAAKIHVSPDGVKATRISEPHFSSGDARLILGIPSYYQKLVVYTGQLLQGKGVDVLIKAAVYLKDDVLLLIVGGRPEQVEYYKSLAAQEHLSNISFTGFVPPWRVESYQQAADLLVLPNTNDSHISAYTSPLKLFEYMSAEKPIVASDLPVFHEILKHKDNAWLVSPGSALALAEGIKSVLYDPIVSQRLAGQAYANVANFSWDHRAKGILFFIEQIKCLYEETKYSAD